MKKRDAISIEQNTGISRRAIIKTASAAAVGIAIGVPAGATCTAPASTIEYGGDTAHGQVKLNETNIYPLLVAWLILTTNGNATALSADKPTLMKVAGVGSKTADALIATYGGVNSVHFSKVRTAFQAIAKQFAAGAAPYNNGQCPDKAETLECIVALP